MAHIDRRAVFVQGPFDGFDGPVDTRAVPSRLGQQHPFCLRAALPGR